MKIALYEYTSAPLRGCTWVREVQDDAYVPENSVRVSEIIDVTFPPRKKEEVIPEQIKALDEQITELNKRTGLALAELRARKAELLAISDQRVSA